MLILYFILEKWTRISSPIFMFLGRADFAILKFSSYNRKEGEKCIISIGWIVVILRVFILIWMHFTLLAQAQKKGQQP